MINFTATAISFITFYLGTSFYESYLDHVRSLDGVFSQVNFFRGSFPGCFLHVPEKFSNLPD